MIDLTPRQQEVLDFMKKHHEQFGYYAGKADIRKQFGFSYNTAQYYMKLFIKKGHLEQINRGIYRPVK